MSKIIIPFGQNRNSHILDNYASSFPFLGVFGVFLFVFNLFVIFSKPVIQWRP